MPKHYILRFGFVIAAATICFLFVFFQHDKTIAREDSKTASPSLLAPNLSATKNAALQGDQNGNGVVNPGDVLRYTIQVQNTGADPATNLTLNDTLDANTTLQGTPVYSPIAVNETYSSIGNVGISIPDGGGDLLSNDHNPNGSGALVITAVNTAGTQGTVSVNTTTGSFTFNPNPGFEGSTAFSYTLSNGTGLTDTATVTINVSGMIWFIDNTVAANGDGRLSSPFNSIANFNAGAADDAGDNLFIFSGSGNYTGGITLLNNQRLIGSGASQSLAAIAGLTPPVGSLPLPATGVTAPNIMTTAAATTAITLGQNNTLRGISIGNTTGAKIAGTSFGTLTVGAPSGAGDVTLSGNGQALNLSTGTLAARFASISSTDSAASGITLSSVGGSLVSPTTTVTNSTGIGINVQSSTAGANFDFGNSAVNQTNATAVNLNANTGAIAFADLDIAPDAGQLGLFSTNNTGTLTTTSGTITTTNAAAVNITQSSGTSPINVQLTSVSTTGGANGIFIQNTTATGSPGGFRVLGTGSAGTGGTIQNGTTGISLTNTASISLDRMQLSNFSDFAIRGNTVNGFSLLNSTISGVNGNNDADDEGSVSFDELTGNASLTNVSISGGWEDNFRLNNTIGTLDRLTFSNCNIGANSASFGNTALNLIASGNAIVKVTVNSCTFTGSRSHFVQFLLNGNSTPNGEFIFTNNSITQSMMSVSGAGNVFVSSGGNGNPTLTYKVQGNTMRGAVGNAINISKGIGTGNFSGIIDTNTIGVTGVANSGSTQGNGITVIHVGGGTHTTSITGNIIRRYNTDGILIQLGDSSSGGNGAVNATITGNTIKEPDSFALHGIELNVGTTAGDSHFLCASIGGAGTLRNDANGGGNAGNGGFDFRLRQRQSTTIRLPNYGGANNDNSAVTTYIQSRNNTTPTVSPSNTFPTGGGFVGGAACTLPSLALQTEDSADIQKNDFADNLISTDTEQIAESNEQIESFNPTVRANLGSAYEQTAQFVNQTANGMRSFVVALAAQILPSTRRAAAQPKAIQSESQPAMTNNAAPLSGETITKNLGTLPPGESITIRFDALVDANIPTNDFSVANTANFTADGGININSTTANTTVVHPPTVSKAFGAPNIIFNDTTTLTLTVTNANPSTALTNVAFTDNLPPGLLISTPSGLVNNCGTTVTANDGSSFISLSGNTRPANSTCTITLNVRGTTEGAKNNTTTVINSTQGGQGLTSNTATVNVLNPPLFSKSFGAMTIPLNGITTLSFTINNQSAAFSLSGVGFADNLPAGLIVAAPPNVAGSCGGGIITANAGANSISLTGATLATNSSCTFSVDVQGTTAGVKTNSVTLSTAELGNTPTAAASVSVISPPAIAKSFSPSTILLNNGFSTLTISISNPSANTLSLTGVGVTDNFPIGMEIDAIPASTNSCGSGIFSPTAGATSVSISGATIPANTTCNFTVRVKGTTAGVKVNTTEAITSANGGAGGTASANLTVTNTAVWTGASSADWNTGSNWNPQAVPTSNNDVDIPPTGVTNNPTISASDVTIGNLTENSPRILTVNSARTLTVTNACTINGALNVAGAFSCGSLSSIGSINFTGAAAQNIPALAYNNFGVNNPAGVNLTGNTIINGMLTLTNGIVNTGANSLTIGTGGMIGRTSGHIAGNLRKDFGGVGNFTFHVGDADGDYSPVAVNATAVSAGANLTVSVTDAALSGMQTAKSISRYWTLTGANLTANLAFTYLDADVNGNETEYRVFKKEAASTPISLCAAPCVNTAVNTVSVSGVSSFSDWTAGEGFAPTAANIAISGKVLNASGRGVANARVILTDAAGNTRFAQTNSFGYYRFIEIRAGETYVLSVSAKNRIFAQSTVVVNVTDVLNDIDFIAEQ